MKNLALLTMIGCSLGLVSIASARENDASRPAYQMAMTWPWSHGLQEEINHLNRMRGHVRWQFRNYKASRETRQNFFRVSHDIDNINARFKTAHFDKRALRRDVERAHIELHRVETALKVKERDYYPWR